MERLLTTIMLWLAINFGLTASYERPCVEFVPPAKMEKFLCPQEREKDAYRAPLALFDRTIEQKFKIDPMTVLVRTDCLQ